MPKGLPDTTATLFYVLEPRIFKRFAKLGGRGKCPDILAYRVQNKNTKKDYFIRLF
jgi:hypothetical protein